MPRIIRKHHPPYSKNYTKYKPYLRQDFNYRCAYCTIHEGEFGGLRNFVVEHFRPKWKFPELECEYTNGNDFVNFTTKDGLADNNFRSIHQSSDGVLWFGTWGSGISRYDGNDFVNFTTKDGLADNNVIDIHQSSDGVLWFGTGSIYGRSGNGVSRYGRSFEVNKFIFL